MKISNLIFLGLLFLLAGCGAKPEGTSSVKLQIGGISGLMAAGSSVQFDGGVIVVGHRLDDSQSVRLVFNNGAEDKVAFLKKGQWEFAAVGWTKNAAGDGAFTGINRCAYTGIVDIVNDDTFINFNMLKANCSGFVSMSDGQVMKFSPDLFRRTETVGGVGQVEQFVNFKLMTCGTLETTYDELTKKTTYDICNGGGITTKYKIAIKGGYKAGPDASLGSLESSCLSPGSITDVKIPLGSEDDHIMDFEILLYTTGDCSGTPIIYSFKERSLVNGITGITQKAAAALGGSSDHVIMYVEHNASTVTEFASYNSMYGDGHDGDLILPSPVPTYSVPGTHYFAISSATASGTEWAYSTDISTSGIQPGDEVMWYVTDAAYDAQVTGKKGCGSSTSYTAGDMVRGMYGVARVTGTTTNTIYLSKGIHQNVEKAGGLKVNLNSPNFLTDNYCKIQFVKLYNWNSITQDLNATMNASISALDYDGTKGGILAFKVRHKLALNNPSYPLVLNVEGKGPVSAEVPVGNKSLCSNAGFKCVFFGEVTAGGANGGILVGSSRVIDFADSSKLKLTARGPSSASGGWIEFMTSDLLPPPPGTTAVNATVEIDTYGTEYINPNTFDRYGVGYFNFCQKSPNVVMTALYGNVSVASSTKPASFMGDGFVQRNWVCAQ